MLGYPRHCQVCFSSSLGYLIPRLIRSGSDTECSNHCKCKVMLDPELSSTISSDDILLLNKSLWVLEYHTHSQGHLVDLPLLILKML